MVVVVLKLRLWDGGGGRRLMSGAAGPMVEHCCARVRGRARAGGLPVSSDDDHEVGGCSPEASRGPHRVRPGDAAQRALRVVTHYECNIIMSAHCNEH